MTGSNGQMESEGTHPAEAPTEATANGSEPSKEQETASETASNKNESTYSTRGRAGDQDPLERLLEAAHNDKAPSNQASFLSETLTEEERRTRTRYIPQVDGMHALKKQQIKSDLSLARAPPLAHKQSRNTKRGYDDINTNGDAAGADEGASLVEMLRSQGAKVVVVADSVPELLVPSPAFVPPPDVNRRPTPRESEAVTAFNPPRPQESIGAKKKHRMLRWERRPADIEVDLTTYRKTVDRTRQELRDVEQERNRIQTVDNHMRRHYFQHLKCLSDEMVALCDELNVVQHQCIQQADLQTSRTRTRGAGKSGLAMKDVLGVLSTRGQQMMDRNLSVLPQDTDVPAGVGGVGALSFGDWNRLTEIKAGSLADAWIVAGDMVETPYGMGHVASVSGVERLDPIPSTDAVMSNDDTFALPVDKGLLAPRIAVKLPFGVGYFPLEAVTSRENPAMYNDARLALRWKGILESAVAAGDAVDVEAMADILVGDFVESENAMEIDDNMEPAAEPDAAARERLKRLLPFGAGMLPSSRGRGGLLEATGIPELDRKIHGMLYEGGGILGSPDNLGVPTRVRTGEDARQERLALEAQVRHLRNKLYRQRKIRILNEKTEIANQERAVKVQALVSEMRADMKSLKNRLAEDIRELGIAPERAESILESYYNSLDIKFAGEASPSKRPRRETKVAEEQSDDDMDTTDVQQTDLSDMELMAKQ